jgi:hypothetical protein
VCSDVSDETHGLDSVQPLHHALSSRRSCWVVKVETRRESLQSCNEDLCAVMRVHEMGVVGGWFAVVCGTFTSTPPPTCCPRPCPLASLRWTQRFDVDVCTSACACVYHTKARVVARVCAIQDRGPDHCHHRAKAIRGVRPQNLSRRVRVCGLVL